MDLYEFVTLWHMYTGSVLASPSNHQSWCPSSKASLQHVQIGFFKSGSAYTVYKKHNTGQADFMHAFEKSFMAACGARDGSKRLSVSWTIFLLLCKVERKDAYVHYVSRDTPLNLSVG